MKTLIKDVDIVTLDEKGTVIRGGAIAIDGAFLVAVGKTPEDFAPDTTIDGTNHVAVPGFFNAHCHASMSLVRGYAEDLPLDRWFNERVWVAESALGPDEVRVGAQLAACEMIRSGTVAFNDHYFYMDHVAEVVEASGLRASLTWCQFGTGKEVGVDLEGALAFAERWNGKAEGRIRAMLGPHSPYVCPPAFLREIAALAKEKGLGLHIHLAESEEQVSRSLATHGVTPTRLLEDTGVLDVPTIAAHALYLSDDDVAILARRGATVAYCPITYMKLAMGPGDVPRLLRAGVSVALGTDGPASNNDMDMKEAVRFLTLLQKLACRDAEALAGDASLRVATQAGARAMGFPEAGALEAGRAADLVLFDFDKPHLVPRHDLVANLVHAAKGSDVSHVFVAGKLVYADGTILTLDEEKIRAEAERAAFRMVSRDLTVLRAYTS
ncbi:amidohydrolase [Polyangium sorediatum]|uniref:5-methylthioadenosine/S-adenosylhomocysteine deaminase n=1 Tax=Polyangium sorediatum TaxID=889274 RepID=A0ABT6NIG7_9BACT|nr:amidohydrolase [Polyangium sorediatum]MDI1428110.1 amidohydrolase [Polyangium sorediatum]